MRMTSTMELDRPGPHPKSSGRRRRLIALVAVAGAGVTMAAAATASVVTHSGDEHLPAGAHGVAVYTVDDVLSTVVPPADRPGVVGRFVGMCDADTYYVEVDGTGLCVVLNGPLGSVEATGTGHGPALGAVEAAKVRDIVHRSDRDTPEPATRVVLGYDGGWAGMVEVADLDAGGPVTGSVID